MVIEWYCGSWGERWMVYWLTEEQGEDVWHSQTEEIIISGSSHVGVLGDDDAGTDVANDARDKDHAVDDYQQHHEPQLLPLSPQNFQQYLPFVGARGESRVAALRSRAGPVDRWIRVDVGDDQDPHVLIHHVF